MSQTVSRRDAVASMASVFPFLPFFRRKPSMGGARFREIRNGTDRRRYIWIHGNEVTAKAVLEEHMEATSGRAFLIGNTRRNVAIRGGELDPNRMFSREGAGRNLQSLNPGWSAEQIEKALDRLDRDRPRFLKRILPPPGLLLVALHNNTEGEYSVKDEAAISDSVALNDKEHTDEFMIATDPADFAVLANNRFNVVLQSKAPPTDDGSLSRLCASRGIRYVNIEARHGNAEQQKRMLAWLERSLP